MCTACVRVSVRRYVVAWQRSSERGCTTETLRSLRSSMLSWGRGGSSAGSSKPMPAPSCHNLQTYSSGDEAGSDCEAQGSLLSSTTTVARRRHAIRFKRKSKIAFRVIRSVPILFVLSRSKLTETSVCSLGPLLLQNWGQSMNRPLNPRCLRYL